MKNLIYLLFLLPMVGQSQNIGVFYQDISVSIFKARSYGLLMEGEHLALKLGKASPNAAINAIGEANNTFFAGLELKPVLSEGEKLDVGLFLKYHAYFSSEHYSDDIGALLSVKMKFNIEEVGVFPLLRLGYSGLNQLEADGVEYAIGGIVAYKEYGLRLLFGGRTLNGFDYGTFETGLTIKM